MLKTSSSTVPPFSRASPLDRGADSPPRPVSPRGTDLERFIHGGTPAPLLSPDKSTRKDRTASAAMPREAAPRRSGSGGRVADKERGAAAGTVGGVSAARDEERV